MREQTKNLVQETTSYKCDKCKDTTWIQDENGVIISRCECYTKDKLKKLWEKSGIKDLNASFPAKFARLDFGWKKTAMMCHHELDVPNSLPMCLRVMLVVNCGENFEPEFVYLKGAEKLRG